MEAVTALLAHPDDELMCAGTLARFADEGATVRLLVGFLDDYGPGGEKRDPSVRCRELADSADAIGCQLIDSFLGSEDDFTVGRSAVVACERHLGRPDLLISHRVNDANTSHGHMGRIARTLARKNRMDLWEIDQSIPGGLTDQAPNHMVDISDFVDPKRAAVQSYASQLDRYPGMDEAIAHRDALYGWHIGTSAAEGFTIVRSVL